MDRIPLDHYPADRHPSMPPPSQSSFRSSDEPDPFKISFLKGPKRKRLAKACDACHKSKRRCDGTAPCSNCYFAAKDCTYTDSSGRPVPAPLASKSDKPSRPAPTHSRRRLQKDSFSESSLCASTSGRSSTRVESLTSPQALSDAREDGAGPSKRPRVGSISFPTSYSQTTALHASRSTPEAARFEVPVVRELVSLFFAHCHPHRLFIHQPTFMADVSLGRIPSYLLYALCALAATFSKHPAVRTDPHRSAGLAYAKTTEELMFDSHGRLRVDRNLMTAQALCLLESHQSLFSCPWPSPSTHHQLALTILKEDLHIQDEYHGNLASAPTTSFELDAIGRECARRAFWYIRLMQLTAFTFFQIPAPPTPMDLNLRLPVDEASFEFGAHNSQSEYLHLPAPRTQYVSEYGHLLRIASVFGRLEGVLNAAGIRPTAHDAINVVIEEAEQDLSVWESSLADHVSFSEESTTRHLAMFETSSNAGAWCYFMMHTLYAWCVLTLSETKAHESSAVVNSCREWARGRLMLIGTKLGNRAKNNILLVAIISALSKFGMSKHPQVQAWEREYKEACGMDPPTKSSGGSRMPLAEALASTMRPTLPPLPSTVASTANVDRVENRSDSPSTGSSGTYFNSLRSSYNKHRTTATEPAASGSAQSLPSLKSSGLLESRPPQPPPPSHLLSEARISESLTSPTPPWMALRMANVPKEPVAGPSEATTSPSALSRGSKSTMPVGLDWLANEL